MLVLNKELNLKCTKSSGTFIVKLGFAIAKSVMTKYGSLPSFCQTTEVFSILTFEPTNIFDILCLI